MDVLFCACASVLRVRAGEEHEFGRIRGYKTLLALLDPFFSSLQCSFQSIRISLPAISMSAVKNPSKFFGLICVLLLRHSFRESRWNCPIRLASRLGYPGMGGNWCILSTACKQLCRLSKSPIIRGMFRDKFLRDAAIKDKRGEALLIGILMACYLR